MDIVWRNDIEGVIRWLKQVNSIDEVSHALILTSMYKFR